MKVTRQVLIKWSAEHQRQARSLREQAARLVTKAEALERKATLCERDAEEMA